MDPTRESANVTLPTTPRAVEQPRAAGVTTVTLAPQRDLDADADADLVPATPQADHGPADTLSPAVRRLVRQYELDITGIHGTGPSGRIRVGDLMGLLGGRTEPNNRFTDTAGDLPPDLEDREPDTPPRFAPPAAAARAAAAPHSPPMSTVFECDLSRVLAHRKQQRRNNVELLLTSYYLAACVEALQIVPDLTDGPAHFGVLLASADGELRSLLVDTTSDSLRTTQEDRLRALDDSLRASVAADLATANLLVHHYGASGSLLATPTPIGAGHAGSLGIGRVRRQIVVRTTDGDETPRVAALCHVSLSFLPERLPLQRANRFLGHLVRVLEQWPEPDGGGGAAVNRATGP
jgi:pyruvate/2-oxoglutarate dehydrogenase complex dihydrolipoamide acyltransferase (E2) component